MPTDAIALSRPDTGGIIGPDGTTFAPFPGSSPLSFLDFDPIQAAIGGKRYAEAFDLLAAKLEKSPDDPDALINSGVALRYLNRSAEAIPFFERAEPLVRALGEPRRKDLAALYVSLAAALMDLGLYQQSEDAAIKSFLAYPNPMCQWSLAIVRLMCGNLAGGWPIFAKRRALPQYCASPQYPLTEWDGVSKCQNLLVVDEQGIGERILYAGVFEELRARTGATSIYIQLNTSADRLKPLFERSFPWAKISLDGVVVPGDCVQVYMGDALRFLRPTFDSFRVHSGYVAADPVRHAGFRKNLAPFGIGPVIGLSWRSKNTTFGAFKSLTLDDLLPLFRACPEATFVNLQYGFMEVDQEIAVFEAAHGVKIAQPMSSYGLFSDLDGVAALVAACDHVVTVSNINSHMAGALGVPVHLLLHKTGFSQLWYWFLERTDSPWYPSMQIHRSGDDGFATALENVAAAINGEHDDGGASER